MRKAEHHRNTVRQEALPLTGRDQSHGPWLALGLSVAEAAWTRGHPSGVLQHRRASARGGGCWQAGRWTPRLMGRSGTGSVVGLDVWSLEPPAWAGILGPPLPRRVSLCLGVLIYKVWGRIVPIT